MQSPNVLENLEYPNLPKSENDSVQAISRDVLAWLAGIIDGEGCIHFSPRSKKESRKLTVRVRIDVGSSSAIMIRKISEIWYAMGLTFCYSYQKTYRKDYMRIILQGLKGPQKMLRAIRPFLVTKQEEADIVLEYLDWRLSVFPVKIGTNTANLEEIRQKFYDLQARLANLRKRRYSFQRLPRTASRPLELTKLEVMV
jgi:intein/homing endonuclease